MNAHSFSEYEDHDRDIIRLLRELRTLESAYPPELLAARRAALLTHAERLHVIEHDEGVSTEDEEIVDLLTQIRTVQVEYPADLLAARRSALLQHMERAAAPTLLDQIQAAVRRMFPSRAVRLSLVLASLFAAVFLGSLVFSRAEPTFVSAPSPVAAAPTLDGAATGDSEVTLVVCGSGEQTSLCSPGVLDASEDLARSGNGSAQPAVSNDGVYTAAYVNDGRGGDSWVSRDRNSWLKIDLGRVTTINTVSLETGRSGDSNGEPGQFVIAVALSDTYADGDSSADYQEYAQIFRSEQVNFSGTVSSADAIRAHFPAVQARFVKITFERAGTAIEDIGVFLVEPPVLAAQPTRIRQDGPPGNTSTPASVSTLSAQTSATLPPASTVLPTGTAVAVRTNTVSPSQTPLPSNTPTALPTSTLAPTDTSTVPTELPPSDTPVPAPLSTEPIVVTGNGQTLTFTCSGNAVEVHGHNNTVNLLGSCGSITVTGNGNQVFWQFGSPVITDRGQNNMIRQL